MATLDYTKNPSDQRVTVWISPSGGSTLGITDVNAPLADELNNTGGTAGVINASPSISWNDYDFGIQASETTNQPSFADAATFEEFGQYNYGGGISFYYPAEYDDASNNHSVIYDLTDIPGGLNDIAVRIDGDLSTTTAAADGQFVSVYRVQGEAESNPFTPGESKRRTVNFINKGDFSHFAVVGTQTVSTVPSTTATPDEDERGRFRAIIQGRDVTNAMKWSTSDGDVIDVLPGGFYTVTGDDTDTATVTATSPSGTTATIAVTVTVP